MSKKMMKRSLALGALMAFVITGSAMAADNVLNGNMYTSDVRVEWDGSPIVNTQLGGTQLGESNSGNRSYGFAVTTGSYIVDKVLNVNNSVSGTERNYGIAIESGSSLTIMGVTDVSVSGTNKQQLRGIRNNGGTLTFNDEVVVEVSLADGVSDEFGLSSLGYVTGVDTWNGSTVFNSNSTITANANYKQGVDWVNAVQVGDGGTIEFNGSETNLTAINKGYTAQAIKTTKSDSVLKVNSALVNIKSKSDIGVNGIAGSGKVYFDGKDAIVNIDVIIDKNDDGIGDVGRKNAIGAMGSLEVSDAVHEFNVTVNGSGVDVANFNDTNGTAAILAFGDDVIKMNAQKFTATVIAGTDEDRTDNTYGIRASAGGEVTVTSAVIDIDVTDAKGSAYGVRANCNDVNFGSSTPYDAAGVINLGGENSIVIVDATAENGFAVGIAAHRSNNKNEGNASSVTVNGQSLTINATGATEYGVLVMNNTTDSASNVSTLTINSKDATINADNGIVAFSQGTVNVNGNLTVNSENGSAILARGASTTNINVGADGKSLGNTVVLNGDVEFAYDTDTSKSPIDANVNINLDGEGSSWSGKTVMSKDNEVLDYAMNANGDAVANNESANDFTVSNFDLALNNNATWNVKGDSFVNTLTGADGNVVLATESATKDSVDVATVAIGANNSSNITVSGDAKLTEALENGTTDATVALTALSNAVTTGVGEDKASVATTVKTAEGKILGSYVLNEDGSVDLQESSASAAVSEAGMNLKAHWRAHMNDMNKRMGELRMANGEAGIWTRMVRGESEYQGAKMQYNQYQLGYDEKLSVDKRWTVGAAVTFAEGDSSYGQGSSEDKSTAFAIYGTKLNNDGTFVDLIARYARLESDIEDSKYDKGEYDTNGMSISAEFGKRIQQGNGLWIEPQVELTYGSVDSATVKFADGSTANYGDMDSFIGRVGFSLGKDIKQGNVYARASYLYDFDGETETTFTNGTVSGKPVEEDFGGGWWEVGVGANINLSKATYIYADIEKTFGGEVDTNWQWNLGVRYSF